MSDNTLLTYSLLDRSRLTPMMVQYLEQKEKCQDAILMFRLGDFYEMFFDDAITASKVLELALTGRDCGQESRAPMCGVPHHAAQSYMQKLVSQGYKVAICDQMEDPALAKGIVKRSITRIITPGTILDSFSLDEKKNNYLMSIYRVGMQFGVAFADITTGDIEATQLIIGNTNANLINLIARYLPSEIICNSEFINSTLFSIIENQFSVTADARPSSHFSTDFAERLKPLHPEIKRESDERHLIWSAAGALLKYIEETQQSHVSHLKPIKLFKINDSMELDVQTRTNLELTQTIRSKAKKGSLLWVIDRTSTAMGGRLLRKWLDSPLLSVDQISSRSDAIEEAKEAFIFRQELIEAISGISDLERISSKASLASVTPRDLISLRNALRKLPFIKSAASRFSKGVFRQANDHLDELSDICKLLEASISEDAPISLSDGGIIRQGYSEEADQLRDAAGNAKSFILKLESDERERTGIKNLKIGYNRVFGYYIELSKGNMAMAPENYIRKQTLANAERYITDELKKMEDTILGAQQRLTVLEYELFCRIRDTVAVHAWRIYSSADSVAVFDIICSLAELAEREHYVRPIVDESEDLIIEAGRHPVVEKTLQTGEFVSNDTLMNENSRRIMILTGPNMAGKSTYMRQVSLIVLLAQMGSFVPAKYARIGIVDRIYTRIGASDDISSGQSTFMVEMNEVSTILRNATRRSLLLLDEIGRGTSTFDGLSIAWSILEFISSPAVMFARTIFATHYHELNMLNNQIGGIFLSHVEVEEKDGSVLFLHKIEDGGTDDSYGIEVAKLAGVPGDVISRARVILNELEKSKKLRGTPIGTDNNDIIDEMSTDIPMHGQMEISVDRPQFRKADAIRQQLSSLDITHMTPLESMNLLFALISQAKSEENSD